MTSNILSLFDIHTLSQVRVEENKDSFFINGTLEQSTKCPKCNGSHIHGKGNHYRKFRLPPIGIKNGQLQVQVQKQYCVKCNYYWWPDVPFSYGKERMPKDSFNMHWLYFVSALLKMFLTI